MQPNIALKGRAYPGEDACGDQLDYWQDGERLTCCVVDGLGHGQHAKKSACHIVAFVEKHRLESPEILFTTCDESMRHERGGVMAVAWIKGDQLTYASVGNIAGYLVHVDAEQGTHRVEQLNMDRGMISGGFKKLNVQDLTLTEGDLLIMHSDGLNSLYNLEPWQPVIGDSERLATMLLEDMGKETDDACVLVYRHVGGSDEC